MRTTRTWPRLGAWLAAAVGVELVALAVNRSLVRVAGPSMEPALWPGDRLVTLPLPGPTPHAVVRPGHVVVVADPHDAAHLVVKRVRTIEREAATDGTGRGAARSTRMPAARVTATGGGAAHGVPTGRAPRFEVRGDAPDRSTDSRRWGPLPARNVRRLAVARWPDLRTPLHHARPAR